MTDDIKSIELIEGVRVVTYFNGERWCYQDFQLHRPDGPAIETPDGQKEWWFEGNLHRLDGPAVIRADGDEEWWIHGKEYDNLTFWLMVHSMSKLEADTN